MSVPISTLRRNLFLAVFYFVISAQSISALYENPDSQSNLTFSGAVIDMTVVCRKDEPIVRLDLLMHLHNKTSEPVIVFYPFRYGKTIVFFGSGPVENDSGWVRAVPLEYLGAFGNSRWKLERHDPLAQNVRFWRDQVEAHRRHGGSRPLNGFVVIDSGRYLEFRLDLRLDEGFRISRTGDKSKNGCPTNDPVELAASYWIEPMNPAMHVLYQLSLKGYEGGEGLLLDLRRTWKDSGNLHLDSGDEISYRSDPILFPDTKPKGQ